jgi:hypothetical protein
LSDIYTRKVVQREQLTGLEVKSEAESTPRCSPFSKRRLVVTKCRSHYGRSYGEGKKIAGTTRFSSSGIWEVRFGYEHARLSRDCAVRLPPRRASVHEPGILRVYAVLEQHGIPVELPDLSASKLRGRIRLHA